MNEPTTKQNELAALLGKGNTSLKDIEDAGFKFDSNGYNTFIRDSDGMFISGVPFWAIQMRNLAVKEAEDYVRRSIREAIGLE